MASKGEGQRQQLRGSRTKFNSRDWLVLLVAKTRTSWRRTALSKPVTQPSYANLRTFRKKITFSKQELIKKLITLENTNDQTEITLRAELFAIEKDLPPVNVMFLYNVINKIGELSDRAEQDGHRISLIASR